MTRSNTRQYYRHGDGRRRRFCALLVSGLALWSLPEEGQAFNIQQHQRSSLYSLSLPTRGAVPRIYSLKLAASVKEQQNQQKGSTNKFPRNKQNQQKRSTNKFPSNKELERKIVELGRKGLTDEALAVYSSVEKPTVRLMNSAIDACARARPTRLDRAFQILEESNNLVPNVFTFGALMSACARARRGDKARALLKSMQEKYRVTPNAVVYSSAIAAVARTNPPQPQVALSLLKEATSTHNLRMNVVGYNAALSACARVGDWLKATSVLREMENTNTTAPPPDHVTYGTVLSACEKGEQWDLVLEYAQAMDQLDALALTSVLKACQQLGLAKEALHYINVMKQSSSYDRKTSGWKRKGARQALKGPDAVAYRLAISACARGGAWQEGIALLDEFQAATGEAPDVMAYTAAITGCEYAGEWRRTFSLLDKMRKRGVQPNEVTMTSIIGACATACAQQDAEKGIAFRGKNSNTDSDEDTDTTSPMPLPQHKALQLLNVLKTDETVINPNINVYNAAIRACAEACDFKRALLLMKDLQEQGLEPTIVTFGTLMTAAERVESIEGANLVFRAMKEQSVEPNEIIYGAAISCCRKAGQAERAFLLLRKMVRDGLSPNAATFNTAIMAQVEGPARGPNMEQCLDRSITIYKIMVTSNKDTNISLSKKLPRPNRQSYNLLIRALASNKKPNEAEALLRKMGEAGYVPDVDLYSATVTAYERTGQPLKALQLMESMREDGYDFYDIEVLNAAFKRAVKLVNVVVPSSLKSGGKATDLANDDKAMGMDD